MVELPCENISICLSAHIWLIFVAWVCSGNPFYMYQFSTCWARSITHVLGCSVILFDIYIYIPPNPFIEQNLKPFVRFLRWIYNYSFNTMNELWQGWKTLFPNKENNGTALANSKPLCSPFLFTLCNKLLLTVEIHNWVLSKFPQFPPNTYTASIYCSWSLSWLLRQF